MKILTLTIIILTTIACGEPRQQLDLNDDDIAAAPVDVTGAF